MRTFLSDFFASNTFLSKFTQKIAQKSTQKSPQGKKSSKKYSKKSFYFTFLNSKPLSDEVTEAVHSQLRMFEERHQYKRNNKESDGHAKAQHNCIVFFNSVALGDL